MNKNSSKKQVDHNHEEEDEDPVDSTRKFFEGLGISQNISQISKSHDFYSELIHNLLKVDVISRGRITCSFSVLPYVGNYYGGFHGAAVAAVAERLAIACARTMVAEDKQLFLGELSTSYLSATPINVKMIADASVVRSGRNLTVVSIEIRTKDTNKLSYTAQATLFHLPTPKL
ncbi:unnamed protein product [Amaranthus hypochondriacus]